MGLREEQQTCDTCHGVRDESTVALAEALGLSGACLSRAIEAVRNDMAALRRWREEQPDDASSP